MNLIELLVYISILSTFLISGIFSAYSLYVSQSKENDGIIEKTNQTSVIVDFSPKDYLNGSNMSGNGGFAALFASVCIALGIFMMAISLSGNYVNLYEVVMRAEYRLVARERAEACLEITRLYMIEDYFFSRSASSSSVGNISQYEKDNECMIESFSNGKALVSAIFNGVRVKINAEFGSNQSNPKLNLKKFTLI